MPSRHVLREFAENEIYHVFNRGVEKRIIFQDEKDYRIFTYYLFIYLAPLDLVNSVYPNLPLRLQAKNLNKEVELLSYCLMPNHFHFLLKQNSADGIIKLMKQLTNAYTLYFNQKNKRVGGLVQGRYKAVRIETDEQLIHVSRYIHLNPVASSIVKLPEEYQWSSYSEFLDEKNEKICRTKQILEHFSSRQNYKRFVQDHADYLESLELVDSKLLDEDSEF